MVRIYWIDSSLEGRVVQIDERRSADAAFAVRGADDCDGSRLKDGVKRGRLLFAKSGRVGLRRILQVRTHTIVGATLFHEPRRAALFQPRTVRTGQVA
jgi:hypothetical protein